jgi:phosphatidylinositol glycan class M
MKQELAGTDIDYKVYTDAAHYDSPYQRHTYRYSPILAYMMRFNHKL